MKLHPHWMCGDANTNLEGYTLHLCWTTYGNLPILVFASFCYRLITYSMEFNLW